MKVTKFSLIILLALSSYGYGSEAPKISDRGNGVYSQSVYKRFIYLVDTQTQMCFAGFWDLGGVTQLDCKELLKRQEWKEIITWDGDLTSQSTGTK